MTFDCAIPAPVHNVHLLAHFALSANVISGTEQHRPKTEHQFTEEAGFGVLENLHSFQCVQVNMNRNLSFEFVCNKLPQFKNNNFETNLEDIQPISPHRNSSVSSTDNRTIESLWSECDPEHVAFSCTSSQRPVWLQFRIGVSYARIPHLSLYLEIPCEPHWHSSLYWPHDPEPLHIFFD